MFQLVSTIKQVVLEKAVMVKLFVLFALLVPVLARDRTLILLDNWAIRETHSTYFRLLKGKALF